MNNAVSITGEGGEQVAERRVRVVLYLGKRVDEGAPLRPAGQVAAEVRAGYAQHLAVVVLVPADAGLRVGEDGAQPPVRARADEEAGQAPGRHSHREGLREVGQVEHDPVLQQGQLVLVDGRLEHLQ